MTLNSVGQTGERTDGQPNLAKPLTLTFCQSFLCFYRLTHVIAKCRQNAQKNFNILFFVFAAANFFC